MAVLPLPPIGIPYADNKGVVTEPWRRYYLSLQEAIPVDAPSNAAEYWVSRTNSTLTNEQNIGLLASGYLKTTTALGIATPSTVTTIPAADITPGGTFPPINGSNLTVLQAAYPVGSVYINGLVDTDPATLLGFGIWTQVAQGRVLIGLAAGDPDFDTLGETGGAKTVASSGTVSAPTFTGDPVAAATTTATPDLVAPDVTGTGVSPVTTATGTVSAPTYTGDATSVLPPYVVCAIWMRVA